MYFYQMKKDIIVNIIIIIIIKEGEKEIWLFIAEVPLALFVKTTAFNTLHFKELFSQFPLFLARTLYISQLQQCFNVL